MTRFGSISTLLEELAPATDAEVAAWGDVLARAELLPAGSATNGHIAPEEVFGSNWEALLRTVAPQRPRPLYAALVTLLLVAAVAAPALAFRRDIIDFFTASRAPKTVVVDFARLRAMSKIFPNAPSDVVPADTRRITSVRIDGKSSVLYVAPTKRGGYCAVWSSNGSVHCTERAQRTGRMRYANIGYLAMYPSLGVDTVEGEVFMQDSTVEVEYADGTKASIPYVWVTAPIDAGFFIYSTPREHRIGKTRPVAIVISVNGKTRFRMPIENVRVTITGGLVDHRDRWGESIQTPREAVWTKRRLLYSFNLSDGTLEELWAMPSRLSPSRRCYAYSTFEANCGPARLRGAPIELRLEGGGTGQQEAVIFGQLATRVRIVELRYEDGSRTVVRPRSGFLLFEMPLPRSRPGHRLVKAVGLDSAGHRIGSQTFNPRQPGIYPCRTPKNYGYGLKVCP